MQVIPMNHLLLPEHPELTIQTEAAVPQISIQQLICHAEHALNLNGASHARP